MIINFDALKERDAELYKLAAAYTGCKAGDHKLDQKMMTVDVWQRLIEFNKPPAEEQRPDPGVRVREDTQRAAAAARIQQLQDEGLLDNEANAKLIGDYFRDHKLVFNIANINDVVLHVLRTDLAWAPKLKVAAVAPPAPAAVVSPPVAPVVPAPAPAPAAEVLGLVAGTNEPQLSLESSEYDLRRASKSQVADWLSRKRAVTGKYIRPRGVFGTTL